MLIDHAPRLAVDANAEDGYLHRRDRL